MNIGYDAKRAFQNKTGLGNYSRSLINILSGNYPQHHYTLFAPKQTSLLAIDKSFIKVVQPSGIWSKRFPSWWRTRGVVKDIVKEKIDLYHGLSNELPVGIDKINARSIVTVHDLIFERFPETYNVDERYVHRWKIKAACKTADTVIAISEQTKKDLIEIYKIPESKIRVCYQSCNTIFQKKATDEEKERVKRRYGLYDRYFLFVSSIAPRKNLLTICKAMNLLRNQLNIPLVVIGDGKKEKDEVKRFMAEHKMTDRLLLLNELPVSKSESFISATDFPAIYQQATALIYPSLFEGFGLPVLEALWSGLPVICSDTSSLPEAGGDAALYFPPLDADALAKQMLRVVNDTNLAAAMREKGYDHATKFAPEKYAMNMMHVYEQTMNAPKFH
ncbi:MAG: glycosyltransferase family 1 protein [Chitinophagaceae bacterium]